MQAPLIDAGMCGLMGGVRRCAGRYLGNKSMRLGGSY